jgi:hypothetical protein
MVVLLGRDAPPNELLPRAHKRVGRAGGEDPAAFAPLRRVNRFGDSLPLPWASGLRSKKRLPGLVKEKVDGWSQALSPSTGQNSRTSPRKP